MGGEASREREPLHWPTQWKAYVGPSVVLDEPGNGAPPFVNRGPDATGDGRKAWDTPFGNFGSLFADPRNG